MITRLNTLKAAPDTIQKAASTIKAGGIIVFPTHGLYGLGADAFNRQAVQKLYSIKQRPPRKPILILIERAEQLASLVSHVNPIATQIMDRFWPGKITLVFEASARVPTTLTGGSTKIGVRQPGHPAAVALVKAVGGPITGTSANLSGRPGCRQVSDLEPALIRRLDLILDAGILAGGRGSTVVDVSRETPQILREGIIPASDIMALRAG
jgi:L-threonylcarbamoyladenylate synthase